jgi:hypothetical protein
VKKPTITAVRKVCEEHDARQANGWQAAERAEHWIDPGDAEGAWKGTTWPTDSAIDLQRSREKHATRTP